MRYLWFISPNIIAKDRDQKAGKRKNSEMTITFESVGSIVSANIDGHVFFEQFDNLSEGNSILYGNTAESMGVDYFTLVISYE